MPRKENKEREASTAGIITETGSARKNKTGSWRSSTPEITEKCAGCGMCVWVCPEGGIKIVEKEGKRRAVIDYDYCKGCLVCIKECPVKAIVLRKGDKK